MFTKRSTCLLFSLLCALSLAPALAQSSAPPDRPRREYDPDEFYRAPSTVHGKTILVPIGSTWEGRIDRTISSKHSHPGTAFNIVMASPVVLNGTDVVVPAGSSIVGEVVEAVPAGEVPPAHYKQSKLAIRGKLRVAISGLKTPDGVVHPLVASLVGEVDPRKRGPEVPFGTNIGYVGGSTNFEAVDPSRGKGRNGTSAYDRRPGVVTRRDLFKDPILGAGEDGFRRDDREYTIRSLVLSKRDYYIYSGSPLTIKLQAPFKIGVSNPGMGAAVGSTIEPADEELPKPTKFRGTTGGEFGGGGRDEQGPTAGGYIPQQQPTPARSGGGSAIPADSF